ncbi:MAG: glycoside hydrolase family 97 N-terminal domain-containing protein [Candidatus Sumerlaeota bacterium]|nr:glycoside hydrolase family 97 N-terminal domain-containing protein [Candidatus Sumerlaeota bacterium]
MLHTRSFVTSSLSIAILILSGVAHGLELKSPDGKISITFEVKDFEGAKDCPIYRVAYNRKAIIRESRLGLEIEGAPMKDGLEIVKPTASSHDSVWKPVYGERDSIRDNYNQTAIELKETQAPHRRLMMTIRAYNEGAAFCYTIPKQEAMDSVSIAREQSEFRFLGDHTAWAVYSAQGKYSKVTLSKIKPGCERPLTIQIADDLFVSLAEARLVDYARMKFAPLKGQANSPANSPANSLVSELSGGVKSALPLTTPWRVIMIAESAGRLLENNFIILNLNDPCAIADTSWIKPGKVIREVTLSTVGGKACVDFAARRNLQYVEFDAGWYGPEGSPKSDARDVHLDPARSKGPLDLQEVIRYGNERGVSIILYVNHLALEKQADEVFPLYQKWGVKGVKFGFVNVGSQQWTSWLHEAIRKAAQYHLMVDVHDEYRPTGYARTYPNLMTQEGISGDETSPVNSQTLALLFMRFLAGPADNTICYYDQRVDKNASHAFQLAKAVCLYSPWQFLYWYDRPSNAPQKLGGAGNAQTSIGDEPELEFYDRVPTVWNETKVIHGRIGEYAVIARRSGESWFIGCLNSGEPRSLDIPLAFLPAGKKYAAHIYSDDPKTETRTHVKIERFLVDSSAVLKAPMTAQGGMAIRLEPKRDKEDYPAY